MTIINVMLDLETWGNEPGRDIRSIGACVFDPITGTVANGDPTDPAYTFYTATDNPVIGREEPGWIETLGFRPNVLDPRYDQANKVYRAYPLSRDPQTVQWWSEQSEEAQAAFAEPTEVRQACRWFEIWLNGVCRDPGQLRLWSHGAHYDGPILAAVFKACDMTAPWFYRAPRDTRTIFDAAGINPERWFEAIEQTGTHHHAMHDAINQAKAVNLAHQRLRNPTEDLRAIGEAVALPPGYQYGEDAMEQVRFGAKLATDAIMNRLHLR